MRKPSFSLSDAVWFALGFLATICQVLLLREFMVFCGGSELGIAVLLSTWLFGIVTGALASFTLMRIGLSPRALLPPILTMLALASPFGLVLIRYADLLIDLPAGALASLPQLATVAFAASLPPSALVGLAFPLACRWTGTAGASTIGRVYALEAAGSVCAGLAHTFLLVTRLPALQIALLSGAGLALAATALASRGLRDDASHRARQTLGRCAATAATLILLVSGLWPGAAHWLDRQTLEHRWGWTHPGIELLDSLETPYQRLETGRFSNRTLLAANGMVLGTIPDRYGSTLEGHFILSLHPAPERVLLIGGLELGVLTPMLSHPGLRELVLLEQDPVLPELYRTHAAEVDHQALADPRLRLVSGDGRRFVNRDPGGWDLVAVLLPDPATSAVNRCYTTEFYAACHRLLRPGGLLLCRVTASENYLGGEAGNLARSIMATLQGVFPQVEVAGGTRLFFLAHLEWAAGRETFKVVNSRVETLEANFLASGTRDGIRPPPFSSLAGWDRTRTLLRELTRMPDGGASLRNSDNRPQAQLHTLRLWSRFSGDSFDHWFRILLQPLPDWVPVTLAALALGWALLPLLHRFGRPRGRGAALPAVVAAGFCGMALELLCITVHQSACGTLYRMIGSLVALFMLGLALGGAGAAPLARRVARTDSLGHHRILALGLAGQGVMALAAPGALLLLGTGFAPLQVPRSAEVLVLLLATLSGWFTGLALPAAGGILIHHRHTGDTAAGQSRDTGLAASLVNSADHLGAAAAALLVGLLIIPRLGVSGCAGLLVAISWCCALRLLLEGWREKAS